MQANAERGQGARTRDRIVHGRSAHHQARRGEDPFSMGALDGVVHGQRKTEVIGCDDECLHVASPTNGGSFIAPESR
jgi:hypothetical protein